MKRFINSLGHACSGLAQAWKTQPNFRIQLVIAGGVLVAGLYFRLSAAEWCVVALATGQVLAAELFNTVAEDLVNWIEPSYHERARIIKDTAAAATWITAVVAAVAGLVIFAPRIYAIFY
ncbi:MAG: diacylglycerol kinase family protein [Cyclobacteriaceae bacterium]|nr:diacylglycerol kinase family protein [Cyclobacteriaceae bacterium]MCX7636813.1 diacylglycerol kinase family protein [Cyclobacteriaceae bacterium]MDW8331296.1 diacylglycerol kinase family protein [Cyclobacteriaceae bacterium]